MPKIIQPSFAKGEVGSSLFGRVDTRAYQTALKLARNMIVHQFGGISSRPGTRFIGPVKDHTAVPRLVPFQFKTTDTHILEFGNLYMRVIRNDGHVTDNTVTITGITTASPAVVTTSGNHGYSNGDEVAIAAVVGMTELNGRRFVIANKAATTFELTDQVTGANINSTGFTAYSSAGTSAKIFTLTTPYTTAQLRDLTFVQTADIVTISHPSHNPAELARLSLNNWTITDITFTPDIGFPTAIDATGGTGSAASWKVTAIAEDDEEESLPGTSADPASAAVTGVTKADPAVVSVSSHSFANGEIVRIDSIAGMTELNGRHFTIAAQTSTTFQLLGENSTNHNAWVSDGVVAPTFVDHTNDTDVTISWTAVTGAIRYRIFKLSQGSYGFIGSSEGTSFVDDATATPDLSDTPPRLVEPFIGTDNRPSAVGFHQQRRIFGGSNNKPDTSFFSVIGSFDNFSKSVPFKADDSFSTTLTSREVNQIRHYLSVNNLLVFTSGAEWALSSGGDPRFSIDTITQNPQSDWGANKLPPIIVGSTVLFSQEGSDAVRAIKFSLEVDGYTTNDLSLLVPHMFRGKSMVEWAFVGYPEPIIYMVRDDGELNVLTFNEEQEVIAWTTWDTDGDYESVAAIRPSITDSSDAAYFVVKRTIDGNTVRYIERTDDRIFTDVEDAFFVDSGLTLDSPVTITAVSLAAPGVVTAAAHGFSDDDEVDIVGIKWVEDVDSKGNATQPDQLNSNRYKVDNAATNTFTLKSIEDDSAIDTSSFNAYNKEGKVRKAVGSVGNLHHLANTAVAILADGNVITSLSVSVDGVVTFPRKFSRAQIGLSYTCDMETLDPEPSPTTTIQGKKKSIPVVTVRFENSRGLLIGPDSSHLTEMKQREFEKIGQPTALLTGDKEIRIETNWRSNGRLFLRQKDPLPLTILALIPEMQVTN